MRMLFIGVHNLQNEAILEIVKSKVRYNIDHVLLLKIEEQSVEPNPNKYKVALSYLASFPYGPDVSIQLIRSNDLSENIVAIYNYEQKKSFSR